MPSFSRWTEKVAYLTSFTNDYQWADSFALQTTESPQARCATQTHCVFRSIQSPTYQLSRHLSQLLSTQVGRSPSAVRNSRWFAKFIAYQSLSEEEVLVSFDLVSLFYQCANRPCNHRCMQKTVGGWVIGGENLPRCWWDNQVPATLLRRNVCVLPRGLLPADLWHCYGSPVSVTVANLVMEEIDQQTLSTFDPPPKIWKRHADIDIQYQDSTNI